MDRNLRSQSSPIRNLLNEVDSSDTNCSDIESNLLQNLCWTTHLEVVRNMYPIQVTDSSENENEGNRSNFQLVAAECICNLSLGDQWACVQVAKAAGPYLVALLSGCNYNLMSVSVWALGNLVGSGEKTWKILNAQGLLGKLMKLIVDFDTGSDIEAQCQVHQNSLLAVVQLLYVGAKMLTVEEIQSLTETLEQLTNTSTQGYRVSEYLLSCLDVAESVLIRCKAVVKCIQFMEASELNNETIALFTPCVRTVANLIPESSGVCCSQVFENWKSFQDVVQKILSSSYNHLISEIGWLLGNLLNHPQAQTSLQELEFDLQTIESQFAFLSR